MELENNEVDVSMDFEGELESNTRDNKKDADIAGKKDVTLKGEDTGKYEDLE